MKDILAVVGLMAVAKTGWELYRKYRKMEQENRFWHESAQKAGSPGA